MKRSSSISVNNHRKINQMNFDDRLAKVEIYAIWVRLASS